MTEPGTIRDRVGAEAERIEEDAVYTFKQLYEAADSERKRHYWVGSITAVLSVCAGTSALVKAPDWQLLVPGLSLLVTILTAWMTFVKPAQQAQEFKNAACDFQQLRDDARIFREIELPHPDLKEELLVERIKTLSERRARLRKDSPQPPRWAYRRAKSGVAQGESQYAVDSQ